MGIRQEYLQRSVASIMKINPKLDKDRVAEIIAREIKIHFKDPSISLENDIKGHREQCTVSKLCSWIDKEKPVISGNATFYVQPDVLQSPSAAMLKGKKKGRSKTKKEMFKKLAEGDMDEAGRLDLEQNNMKVIMNAEYGGSGAPSAAFYNKYTPSATTLMAQAIITIIAAFFEGFVGDNQKFFHINELFDWLQCLKKSKVYEWVSVPSRVEVVNRIKTRFFMYNLEHDSVIEEYVQNCSKEELVAIFYANNLNELFRRNSKLVEILREIFTALPNYEASAKEIPIEYKDRFNTLADYNNWVSSEMFMNPYSPPNGIKEKLEKLVDIVIQYCYVDYLTPDSIAKLNNHYRTAVLLVDTDSNVINADLFVSFVFKELFPNEAFGRKSIYNDIIAINVLASILSTGVTKLLEYYSRLHNINEEDRQELSMKTEFIFRILFLMEAKKRYASSMVTREGVIMIPFKTDIKGVDFIKAGVTDEVTERFTKILENRILLSDKLELRELNSDLKEFKKEIYEDLRKGGTTFLKPQSYKPEEAYKVAGDKSFAWQVPIFRAVTVWNLLYPEKKIYSMSRAKILKLIVNDIKDLDVIKDTYPVEYALVVEKIFKSFNPDILKSGLKVIGIPQTVKQIPEWLLPLVDYETIVSDVLQSFSSITKAFKIEELSSKTPSGVAKHLSALISL